MPTSKRSKKPAKKPTPKPAEKPARPAIFKQSPSVTPEALPEIAAALRGLVTAWRDILGDFEQDTLGISVIIFTRAFQNAEEVFAKYQQPTVRGVALIFCCPMRAGAAVQAAAVLLARAREAAEGTTTTGGDAGQTTGGTLDFSKMDAARLARFEAVTARLESASAEGSSGEVEQNEADWLTVTEAARTCGKDKSLISRLANNEKIESTGKGRARRVSLTSAREYFVKTAIEKSHRADGSIADSERRDTRAIASDRR